MTLRHAHPVRHLFGGLTGYRYAAAPWQQHRFDVNNLGAVSRPHEIRRHTERNLAARAD
jgi:hypothetical protein